MFFYNLQKLKPSDLPLYSSSSAMTPGDLDSYNTWKIHNLTPATVVIGSAQIVYAKNSSDSKGAEDSSLNADVMDLPIIEKDKMNNEPRNEKIITKNSDSNQNEKQKTNLEAQSQMISANEEYALDNKLKNYWDNFNKDSHVVNKSYTPDFLF